MTLFLYDVSSRTKTLDCSFSHVDGTLFVGPDKIIVYNAMQLLILQWLVYGCAYRYGTVKSN